MVFDCGFVATLVRGKVLNYLILLEGHLLWCTNYVFGQCRSICCRLRAALDQSVIPAEVLAGDDITDAKPPNHQWTE